MKKLLELINKIARSKNLNINLSEKDLDKSLRDLNIDSLAAITLIIEIEAQLQVTIPDEKLGKLKTLRDLVDNILILKKTL